MSLLQKASIITTPTAYAEDYLYSIKPAYALGSELLTNGAFNDGANNWIVLGSGASLPSSDVSNGVLTIGSAFGFTQNVAQYIGDFNPSERLQVVIKAKKGQSGSNLLLRLSTNQFGASVTTIATVPITTSYQVFTFTYKNNTANNFDWFSVREGNGNGTVLIEEISVKKITDADFDFDRNSTGTRVNEDYLIEDVPYNLLSYTEELTNGYWSKIGVTVTGGFKDPFYGNNAFKVVDTSGGGTAYLHKPSIASSDYGRSIYARTVSGTGTVSLLSYFGNTNNDFTLTEKWQRFYVNSSTTSTGAANFYAVDFRGGDLTEVLLYAPQLTKSPTLKDYLKTTDRLDIPRIDYTNGEPSILLEPQRTNSYEYSNDVTQSFWLNMGILIDTSNLYLSPEGINNAQKITANSGTYRLLRPQTNISGTGYAQSIFVKNINALNFYLRTASGFSYYNFETKTVNLAGSDNLTAIHYPNDWVRLITTTPNASYKQFGFGQSETDSNDIGNSVYIYGAQLEAGSYATSLIHTSGSAVTRSADAANNAGNSDLFNDSEGVLYIETQALVDEADARFISIDAGNGQNRVIIGYPGSASSRITGYLQSSAGGGMTGNIDNIDTTEKHKIAYKYKLNDCSIFIDGVKRLQNNSVTMPVGLNALNFTNGITNSGRYKGNLNSIMVFKEALTDLELAKLTGYNNHELYMNYYNRLSYLGLAEEYNVESDINNYIL